MIKSSAIDAINGVFITLTFSTSDNIDSANEEIRSLADSPLYQNAKIKARQLGVPAFAIMNLTHGGGSVMIPLD